MAFLKKNAKETFEKALPKELVALDAKKSDQGCVECGGDLAPGQTYVCTKHIRT